MSRTRRHGRPQNLTALLAERTPGISFSSKIKVYLETKQLTSHFYQQGGGEGGGYCEMGTGNMDLFRLYPPPPSTLMLGGEITGPEMMGNPERRGTSNYADLHSELWHQYEKPSRSASTTNKSRVPLEYHYHRRSRIRSRNTPPPSLEGGGVLLDADSNGINERD